MPVSAYERCFFAHATASRLPVVTSTPAHSHQPHAPHKRHKAKKRERARTEPDHQTRADAECKEEREALPVVPTSVDDRLDDIRADHGRRAVREPEEAEEHVIEPRRGQLGHHRLREGVVGRLEEPEDDVVRPELPDVVEAESGMSDQLKMR